MSNKMIIEILFIIALIWVVSKIPGTKDSCPHCGYYCTGTSAWCTKHPDSKKKAA